MIDITERNAPDMISAAVQCYLDRRALITHPRGTVDAGGRWHPDATERQECCRRIRPPSRAWPWSLMLHCRTARHIANLYNVDPQVLRQAIRQAQKAQVQEVVP